MSTKKIFGAVLAGGKSSRMGEDKAILSWRNKTMLENAVEILEKQTIGVVICSNNEMHDLKGKIRLQDRVESNGPVSGIITALTYFSPESVLIIACDMPFVSHSIIYYLINEDDAKYDAIVYEHSGNKEPLCAIYHSAALTVIENAFREREFKLHAILQRMNVKYLQPEDPEKLPKTSVFTNINTPDDYQKAKIKTL